MLEEGDWDGVCAGRTSNTTTQRTYSLGDGKTISEYSVFSKMQCKYNYFYLPDN